MTKTHKIKLGIYSSTIFILLILLVVVQIPRQFKTETGFAVQFDHSQVLKFELLSNNFGMIRFSNNGNFWIIEYNGQENLARVARIEDFLSLLGTLRILRTASNLGSLPEFGLELENDGIHISMKHSLGQNFVYKFGNPTALGNEYYFQVDGSPQVSVVSGELGFYLNQSPTYWTELRFWPEGILENDVLGINLEGFDGNIRTFYRDTDVRGQDIWIAAHRNNEIDSRGVNFLRTATSLEFSQPLTESDWNQLSPVSIFVGAVEILGFGGSVWTAEIYKIEDVFFAGVTDGVKNPRYGIVNPWRIDEFLVTEPTD